MIVGEQSLPKLAFLRSPTFFAPFGVRAKDRGAFSCSAVCQTVRPFRAHAFLPLFILFSGLPVRVLPFGSGSFPPGSPGFVFDRRPTLPRSSPRQSRGFLRG